MDIKTLESFKLSDAVKFHDVLNPKIWRGQHLLPQVERQLKIIAKDFIQELGLSDLKVKDITLSGSNAAYTYTPHSDLDLHILVDMKQLPNDEVYQELFNAKKTIYNDSHQLKIHGVPVELYVQDSNQPVVSLGEYSLLKNKWLKTPIKRRANFDQNVVKAKYNKLFDLIQVGLKSKTSEKIDNILKTIKRYRQAGLDKGGEFSPENLAYKAIRNQNLITKLYDLRNKLHGSELSIEEMYSGPQMKFLRPGELRGSYTDQQLRNLGFKQSQNGSWYIIKTKFDELIRTGKLRENYKVDPVSSSLPIVKTTLYPKIDTYVGKTKSNQTQQPKKSVPDVTFDIGNKDDEFDDLVYKIREELDEAKNQYNEIEFVCFNPEYNDTVLSDVQKRLFYTLKNIPGVIPLYQNWGHLQPGQISLSAIYSDDKARNQILKYANQFKIPVDLERPVTVDYVNRAIRGEHEGQITSEDYHPNDRPPGPEFKPTMPAGTVRVDVSDVYDWYKLGQHISNMKGLGKHDFGKGPPSTILSFGDEDTEHRYINDLEKTGLTTTDIDPIDPNQPKGMKRQKVDPTYNVNEKINSEILKKNFYAEKIINVKDVGQLKLEASNISSNRPQQFRVDVIAPDGKKIGYFRFVVHDYEPEPKFKMFSMFSNKLDPYLVAGNVSVWNEYQKKGIATEVYKWIKSMGNDIKPSNYQTDSGKAMWRGFEKNKVAEVVNPDVSSKKYFIEPTENVRMGDFEFNARTFTGGLSDPNARGLQIRAYDPEQPKGQNLIGSADFIVKSDKKGNQWLESDDTEVNDEYRGKGVAAMMYAFAKSLGNDIKPSPYQSQKGREMWSKWGKDAEYLVGEQGVAESLEQIPAILYHATYRPLLKSIKKYGLGGDRAQAKWEDSVPGVVYLALDKNVAESYAETSDVVPEEWLDEIVILKISTVGLDKNKFHLDKNVLDNQGDTVEYHGVIPVTNISLIKQGVAEAFDQPYKLKWEKGEFGDIDAYTILPDGSPLSIMFNKEDNGLWMAEFYRSNTQAVTGEGDAQKIFATVLHAINQFIKKVKPKQITFSTVKENDPTGSRSNLYDRLVQRYASNLGYSVERHAASNKVSYDLIRQGKLKEASGYIPSEKEKNDPRFKTALTVDIKPDTMKKDAKKFGNKISRAGIPPTLNPSGKF